MNLKHLSNPDLLRETKAAILEERSLTSRVLHYLREVEVRRLYLSEGYSSMYVFCMKELGYDEHQTQRRLSAMRLLIEIPEIEPKVASGELSLTALNKAKAMFNKMAKKEEGLEVQQKIEILKTLEKKSIRECEQELVKICPEVLPKKLERQRILTEDLTELKIVLRKGTLEKLSRLKDLLSHRSSNMTTAELIDRLADQMLSKMDPTMRAAKAKERPAALAKANGSLPVFSQKKQTDKISEPNNTASHAPALVPVKASTHTGIQEKFSTSLNRYIPAKTIQQIWLRDKSQCTFTNPVTKKRCCSRFKLEIDHIKPFAMGGDHSLENLRILCQAHNIHQAVEIYGLKKMGEYVPGMKT